MIAWVLVGGVAAAGLVLVLVAVMRDPEVPAGRAEGPTWDLPTAAELRDARFPISWQGYDPAHVDAWVAAVADAWDALVAEADPDALRRARARLDGPGSGEELEDGGGDRPGILDR